jgi:dTDP-4-amino-4,6-dideoxy-D-galactose acyltransferase
LESIVKISEWDSGFFGYNIASVKPSGLINSDLVTVIKDLRKKNVKLIYFFVNHDDEISNKSIKNASGFLVDEKVTFCTKIIKQNVISGSDFVVPYNLNYSSEKLKLLALQSGAFSRFNIDSNFHNNEYQKLYLEWIEKSVRKEISDIVLVYKEENDEKGFITLAVRNDIGSIGLIAVDEKERGKSIGKKLVNEAFIYFIERNIESVEVVTQKANDGACKFYKSLGFEIKSIVNVYHLWIK